MRIIHAKAALFTFRRLKLISKKMFWNDSVTHLIFAHSHIFCTILSTLWATGAWSSGPPLLSMHQSTLMCKLRHACLLPCFWSDWKNRPENVHLIGLDDVSTYYYKLWSKVNCRAVRVCLRITIFLLWCKRFWEIIILLLFWMYKFQL